MRVYRKITDLIGGTPLLELTNYEKANELNAKIYAKLEYFNPAGSVKDRIAKAIRSLYQFAYCFIYNTSPKMLFDKPFAHKHASYSAC